nr:MAG TPA: hypothetical protein [Caudoviricetes sp.]
MLYLGVLGVIVSCVYCCGIPQGVNLGGYLFVC